MSNGRITRSPATAMVLCGALGALACEAGPPPLDPLAPPPGEVAQRTGALGSFTRQMTLSMLDLLRLGRVSATVNTAFDIGDINAIFDGDVASLARTPAVNPAVVTLAFDASLPLRQTRLMLATEGTLTLEIAATLADLNAHTGSYVRAVNNATLAPNVWGSWPLSTTGKFVRATIARINGDDFVHVNEWELAANVTVNDIKVSPSSSVTSNVAKMLAGRAMTLTAKYADGNRYTYPITDPQTWSSSNGGVANVNNGRVTAGGTPGSATLTVSAGGVSQTVALTTVSSFTQTRDAARTRKVAVVIRDPLVQAHGNLPMHQVYGWNDPVAAIPYIVGRMASGTGNTVNYKVVQTTNIGTGNLYTRYNDAPLTLSALVGFYDEGTAAWQARLDTAAKAGKLAFEYLQLLTDLQLCEKRNAGLIDEVWIYTDPFGGMYESRLAGTDTFPYNSPPLVGTTCRGQLPIMGFNYEASLPNAVHSFGHRLESVLTHTFGRWNQSGSNATPNDWEKFSTIQLNKPGQGHVGYTHFPVNGTAGSNGLGYDYGNGTAVTSFERNWQYYPFLQNLTSSVSCNAWSCTDDGYYQYFYGHVPRFTGVSDGLLNDWWAYFIDFLAASATARDVVAGNVGNTTLGFEDSSAWTASVGTKTQDTTAGEQTQGNASLKMTAIGAGVTLTSSAIASTAVTVGGNLSVDVRVPTQLAGQTGAQVKLCLKSPQRGISSYVCSSAASLDGVGLSATATFYTVPWTLPAGTLSALRGGSFTDLQLQVVLSGVPAAAQSATWVFDRMAFAN